MMNHTKIYACFLVFLIISAIVNARPQSADLELVERDIEGRDAEPGWVRRQLMRAGVAASKVGNGLGGYALRLTNAVDKVCAVIKKIIPIVGAVCTVGQFKFCALDSVDGGIEGAETLPGIEGRDVGRLTGPQTNFDEIDK